MNSFKQLKYIIFFLCIPFLIWGLWEDRRRPDICFVHDFLPNGYQANLLSLFSQSVEASLHGKLNVSLKVKSFGTCGNANELALLKKDKHQGGVFFLNHLASIDPLFALDSLPLIAPTNAHGKALWEVSRYHIVERLKKEGFLYLFVLPGQQRAFLTPYDLRNKQTLRGLHARIYSPGESKTLQLLGTHSTVCVHGKRLEEVQAEKKVNAFYGGMEVAFSGGVHRTMPHAYSVPLTAPHYVVVMDKDIFASLSVEEQQVLLSQAQKMEAISYRFHKTHKRYYANQLKAKPMPLWLKKKMVVVGERVLKDWLAKTGPVGRKILIQYRRYLEELLLDVPSILKKI